MSNRKSATSSRSRPKPAQVPLPDLEPLVSIRGLDPPGRACSWWVVAGIVAVGLLLALLAWGALL